MRSTAPKPAGYTYARQLHIDVIQMCNDSLFLFLSLSISTWYNTHRQDKKEIIQNLDR